MLNPEIQNFLSNIWEQFLIYLKNLWTTCAHFFTSSPTVTPIQDISDHLSEGIENVHPDAVDEIEETIVMVNLTPGVILTEKTYPFDNFTSIFKGIDPEIYFWTAGVIVFSFLGLIFNQIPGQTETYNPQMTL